MQAKAALLLPDDPAALLGGSSGSHAPAAASVHRCNRYAPLCELDFRDVLAPEKTCIGLAAARLHVNALKGSSMPLAASCMGRKDFCVIASWVSIISLSFWDLVVGRRMTCTPLIHAWAFRGLACC